MARKYWWQNRGTLGWVDKLTVTVCRVDKGMRHVLGVYIVVLFILDLDVVGEKPSHTPTRQACMPRAKPVIPDNVSYTRTDCTRTANRWMSGNHVPHWDYRP